MHTCGLWFEVHYIYGSQPDAKSSCRSLSRLIDRYHKFASIFPISKNVLTLQIVYFMFFDSTVAFGMMVAYVFWICWYGPFHK